MRSHLRLPSSPVARPEAVLQGDRWRITVLADGLVRLEWSEAGDFEDRASTFALHRDLTVPDFEVIDGEGTLEIVTDRLRLTYDRGPFTPAGLSVQASFEHEFMVEGMTGAPPFSFERARRAEPFGSALVAAVDAAGLEPESWLPEYGEGQFEITIKPANALLAADRAVLLREVVRDVARRHGHRATFAPLVSPDGVGNGVHIHLSLFDATGAPVLYDPQRPGKLSAIGARFAAGVLAHADAVVAVTAPSPASFLRLAPHRWSAGGAFLAERNREALLRICPTIQIGGRDESAQLHLEYRAADATANPWLALAVLLRAGLAGLSEDNEAHVWPETATEADLAGVAALPGDLASALDALKRDDVVTSWFPAELMDTFQLVKRAELAAVDALNPVGVCRRIAEVY